uniref:hypothetical protein n=1 Tax=Nocardia carnea TaxID=37328 RepID=UPI002457A85A
MKNETSGAPNPGPPRPGPKKTTTRKKYTWGSGKVWRVWAGDQVRDLVELNEEIVRLALDTTAKMRAAAPIG